LQYEGKGLRSWPADGIPGGAVARRQHRHGERTRQGHELPFDPAGDGSGGLCLRPAPNFAMLLLVALCTSSSACWWTKKPAAHTTTRNPPPPRTAPKKTATAKPRPAGARQAPRTTREQPKPKVPETGPAPALRQMLSPEER